MKMPKQNVSLGLAAVCITVVICVMTYLQLDHGQDESSRRSETLLAENGFIQVQKTDQETLYSLEGDWEYYEGKLLSPGEFSSAGNVKFRKVPFQDTAKGYQTATLRLKIKTSILLQDFSLSSGIINSASKAWINGSLVWQHGFLGNSTEPPIAAVRRSLIPLPLSTELEIIIQISNMDINSFGILEAPKLASTRAHFQNRQGAELLNTVILGFTLSLILYSIFTLVLDPKQKLNYSLFFLSVAMFVKIAMQFPTVLYHDQFQASNYLNVYAINFAAFYLIVALSIFVLNELVPKLYHPGIIYSLPIALSFLFARLFLLKPAQYYSDIYFVYATAIIAIGWTLYRSLTSKSIGMKFRRSIRIGFSLLAITCLPAIILHAYKHPLAPIIENLCYINFIIIMSFMRSLHQQWIQNKIRVEATKRRHAYTQLVKMIYPHQLAKIKAGVALEDTMPIGSKKECCVICFDIIDSSNLPEAKNILAKIFSSCFDLTMKNYNRYSISADAYRINEVGDGFYCSIGFPFESELDCNYSVSAWDLSLKFLTAVDHISKQEGLTRPINCSIGIAMGELSGFFTKSGIKRYDMYGEAIVLATRYESMRKTFIDPNAGTRHVITLQNKVANQMPAFLKNSLKPVLLDNFKVRNDESAEELYYCLIGDKAVNNEQDQPQAS